MDIKKWWESLDLWYTIKWYAKRWLSPHQLWWRHLDKKKWRAKPKVGDMVCDCRYRHLRIVKIDEKFPDDLYLEDGSVASWMNCCTLIGECNHDL